jgi:murein DD-endopeptidase
VQSVDVLVPTAPVTVRIDGRTHVVYELHLTNLLPVDVSLGRLQVFSDRSDVPLADYRGEELRKRLGRPGLRRDHPTPHVVGPGLRAVAYFWFALPDPSASPTAVRHRIELDVLREAGPAQAVVEGTSPVAAHAPAPLGPPVRGGPWTAIYDPQLKGGHRTAFYTLEGRARIPGRFAIDFIRVPPSGALEKSATPSADWNGLGAEVLAVADAVVAAAADDIPDNTASAAWPGASKPENASGNYIALDLGHGRFAFYEHLKSGSVAVKAGDRVKTGQVIGRLGNSGSSSMGPHLHFHVADTSSLLAAEGLPFVFARFEDLGAFASLDALDAGERWVARAANQAKLRTLERPRPNAVLAFP